MGLELPTLRSGVNALPTEPAGRPNLYDFYCIWSSTVFLHWNTQPNFIICQWLNFQKPNEANILGIHLIHQKESISINFLGQEGSQWLFGKDYSQINNSFYSIPKWSCSLYSDVSSTTDKKSCESFQGRNYALPVLYLWISSTQHSALPKADIKKCWLELKEHALGVSHS